MITLKNLLFINALSSGLTGFGLVAAPGLVANLFEASSTLPFIGAGVFLVVFAAVVFAVARNNPVRPGAVKLIILLDSLWVLVSIAIILLQIFEISSLGYALIAAVAAWVGLMAFLQLNGLKRIETYPTKY